MVVVLATLARVGATVARSVGTLASRTSLGRTLGSVNKLGSSKNIGFVLKKSYLIPDNEQEILKLKTEIGDEVTQNIKSFLDDNDIDFTMKLSNSARTEIDGNNVEVIVDAPHASAIEYGLPPGISVNIDALRNWVEIKLGITEPEERDEVTYKIFNKIKSEGTKPTRFFKKSIISVIKKQGKTPKATRKKKPKILKSIKKVIKQAKRIRKHIKAGVSTKFKT